MAQACMNLGFFKLESGDPRGAIVDLQRSVDIYEQTSPDTPRMASSLYHLANARGAVGQLPESRALLQRVVAIDEKVHGPDSGDVADDLEACAEIERKMGHAAEAERLTKRMVEIRKKLGAAEKSG